MSAPGQDAAQPTGTAPDGQGQGQDRTSYQGVLDESVFSNAPEELRPHLHEYVKSHVDPHITQRFQDAAQFKQTWEPFSQIEGLSDLHPEAVDQLVEFGYLVEAASDEQHPQREQAIEALAETWQQMGEQFGFLDDEGDDGEGDDGGGPENDRIAQLEAQLEELREGRQQDEQRQTVQQIQQEIHSALGQLDLPGEPGSEDRKEAEDAVLTFMHRYNDNLEMSHEQAVQAAYEDYQRLTGAGQRQLLKETGEVNGGQNVRGGSADTAPEEIKGWADADKAAKARLAGANR